MDLFREKLEVGRSLRIAFDDFDGKKNRVKNKRNMQELLWQFNSKNRANFCDFAKAAKVLRKFAKVLRKFAKARLSWSRIGKIILDS